MKKLVSSVFLSGALLLTFSNNSGYAANARDVVGIELPQIIDIGSKIINSIERKGVKPPEKPNERQVPIDDSNSEDDSFGNLRMSRKPSIDIEYHEPKVEDDVHERIAKHIAEAKKFLDNIEEILNRMYERVLRGEE